MGLLRRRWNAVLVALVALVLLGSSVVPAAADSSPDPAGPEPVQRTLFNNPWGKTAAQRRIADEYIRLIRTATPGSGVRIAFYSLSDEKLTNAMIAAKQRGVRIQVLVNRHAWNTKQVKRLRKALGTKRSRAAWVSKRPRNWSHSKFLAIEVGEVSVVSSQNGTKSGIWQQQNDAVVTSGDSALYQALVRQFELMSAGETKPSVLGRQVTSGSTTLRFYPAPDHARNPVSGLLNDITCQVDGRRTKVWGIMWIWTAAGKPVAKKLADLAKQGCDVRMIVSPKQTRKSIQKALLKGGVSVRVPKGSKWPHSKYFVVDGHDADGAPLKVVYAGSPNLTGTALNSNDEVGLTSTSAATVAAYQANHKSLWGSRTKKLKKAVG